MDNSIPKELIRIAKELVGIPSRLNLKTVMNRGKSDRKRQDRDKKQYVAKVGSWLQRLVSDGSKARKLAEEVTEEFPGRITKERVTKRKNRWVKSAKQISDIIKFTEYVGGPKRMYGPALYIVRDVALGLIKLRDAKAAVVKIANKWFMESSIQDVSNVFEEGGYEPDFLQFLPPGVSFKIGPTRDVQSIIETFGREKKNWETMSKKLAFIAERFNAIVRSVKSDMKSSDEVTRLCALMTAITIETGLRPGEVGNMSSVKDPETGEKVDVETFGVTTLQRRHVKFIRENFMEIRFIGKKGTENITHLSDSDILGALNEAVESTSLAGDTAMLFVTKSGEHVGYSEMNKYVSSKWGDITPTDFRKLKATRTFYDKLRNRVAEMKQEIASKLGSSKAKLKQSVIDRIMAALEHAASDAQKALSHLDWKTTIKSYVDPRVVVNFLNQGGLDDTLDDILIRGKNVVLTFNFDAFVGSAKVAKPVVVIDVKGESESVLDVLTEMENLAENLSD